MEVVNLVGDRLFLDYLITQYFNYIYVDNQVKIDYTSVLNIKDDIDPRLKLIEGQLTVAEASIVKDEQYINNLKKAISVLTDLKNKLS